MGESDGISFIAMELVEALTLAERIAEAPIAGPDIVAIALQMVDALEAAHAQGITHRDIKPANLMLTSRGQVKVLDFGLAKEAAPSVAYDGATVAAQTAIGIVMGTIDYMSPEQARGEPVDQRSDLFSVGVVLYQMSTSRLPFAGSSVAETVGHLLHGSARSHHRPQP